MKASIEVSSEWTSQETSRHQDHVIAHLVGASVLGYFVFDEALYILLDIGFVWSILLDGEMGLLPHPVAINELEIDELTRQHIKTDIDRVLSGNTVEGLLKLKPPPAPCRIRDVQFFGHADNRRFVIEGEEANLIVETSLSTCEINFYESREEN